jgi:hypothetical protein
MKIAVVRCDAIGSVNAARLAANNPVLAIAQWQEHVDQMEHYGLGFAGPSSDWTV